MSRRLLLLALTLAMAGVSTIVTAGDGKEGENVLRKSGSKAPVASYPLPFTLNGANARTNPPISTGYYFVDSDDEAPDFWRPDPTLFADTLTEPSTWRRIVSGPRQVPATYWTDPTLNNYGGLAFFRNPGLASDSTDNAFAGPISIGFPFYFNGVRQDSFYVSTNGLIALSNRRYFYNVDNFGFPISRVSLEVTQGVFSAYDPASDDTRGGRSGNGLTDVTADNFGFNNIACGGNVANATGGIRSTVNTMLDQGSLSGTFGGSQPQLIAPAWDDLQVSVYNTETSSVDDFSRVYYKRSPSNDRLIIYFVNLTPMGVKTAIVGGVSHTVPFALNNRPGVGEHYRFSLQVTLNRADSSVQVQYEKFFGIAPRNALQPHAATVWMRCNSTVGVSGPSRRLNWSGFPATIPVSTLLDFNVPKYTQSTEYLFNVLTNPSLGSVRATSSRADDDAVPKEFLAIKFKQYKNILRVINVSYRVRQLNNNANLDFSIVVPTANANNYELLAGEERLGSIQPVAIVQHLTNDVQGPQGVNYTKQGVNFKVRFRIMNEASLKIVYNTSKNVDDAALRDTSLSKIYRCDINGNNLAYQPVGTFVLPYEFIKIVFPEFAPNENIEDQIGRLLTTVIAEPKDSLNQPLGDQWPFDDTASIRIFSMRRLSDFNDDVTEYHIVGGVAMPSVLKWVNIQTDVVDGDEITNNPPPPRGEFMAKNSLIQSTKSPVIRMNRKTVGNDEIPAPGTYGGDELRSFPINLSRKKRAVLSISYQRTGKLTNIGRGFSDNRLIGPEHRVNMLAVNGFGPGFRNPDEVWVEFAKPSDDQLNGITNIQAWVLDYMSRGTAYLQPFRIWGGGGFARGFDLANYNLQTTNSTTPPLGGMREDLFDDGKDAEYYKVTIPIPDTVIKWVNEGARNFRFRLRARCLNNSNAPFPVDDDDNFFIDNVKILFPDEVTDVEFSNIQLIWPYTMAPASQATRVPIRVKLSNNTNIAAPAFSVRVQIKPDGNEFQQVYCRTITVPVLAGNREVLLPFPDANFRTTTPGRYKVTGRIFFPGNDLDTLNDSTFTTFVMTFGPSFAYENNPLNATNDVPKLQFSGVSGKGLNHRGASAGGGPSSGLWAPSPLTGPAAQYTVGRNGTFPYGVSGGDMFGSDAGNASGQIAMRFTLYSQDTVAGYQAYWAELNQDVLNISFSLYRDQGGLPGDERIANSTILRRRGEDETGAFTEPQFGKYVTYLLQKPVVIPPGEYWASVAQMGTEGYELGASETRMGMVTTLYSDIPVFGSGNRTLLIDKNFRVRSRSGALLNDNRFSFELTRFSGDWVPFTPTIGNPGYPHLDAMGSSLGYTTFTRGSWIPMLRPYFGNRSFASPPVFVECIQLPVELSYFDAKARAAGVDVFWETASEKRNAGFHVERRGMTQTTNLSTGSASLNCVDRTNSVENPWTSIGYVPGVGNSTSASNYKFYDANVSASTSYEYRLRQVDVDGAQSFSNIVNVEFGSSNVVVLDNNYPNPVNEKTTFGFIVPVSGKVKLEVFDLMGNLVRTVLNKDVTGSNSPYAVEWDSRSTDGTDVASGSYLYKLTVGETVLSKTLTVVR